MLQISADNINLDLSGHRKSSLRRRKGKSWRSIGSDWLTLMMFELRSARKNKNVLLSEMPSLKKASVLMRRHVLAEHD